MKTYVYITWSGLFRAVTGRRRNRGRTPAPQATIAKPRWGSFEAATRARSFLETPRFLAAHSILLGSTSSSERGLHRQKPTVHTPDVTLMNLLKPPRIYGTPLWNWGAVLGTTVICWGLSGWPAGLLAAVTGLVLWGSTKTTESTALLASSTCWPLASAYTGDRRFFFAFTCWLATLSFMHHRNRRYWTGVLTSFALMTLFFLIRVHQGASGRVLWVELVASITLGGLAVVLESAVSRSLWGDALAVVAISLLAAFSLFV